MIIENNEVQQNAKQLLCDKQAGRDRNSKNMRTNFFLHKKQQNNKRGDLKMADGCYDLDGKCVNCNKYHPCDCENTNNDRMSKQRAYEIVNGIGGICATKEEANEALNILEEVN
jgi:hypothetical protein